MMAEIDRQKFPKTLRLKLEENSRWSDLYSDYKIRGFANRIRFQLLSKSVERITNRYKLIGTMSMIEWDH